MKRTMCTIRVIVITAILGVTVMAETSLDWYINYGWYGGKWGRDLVTQEITKKTGISCNYIVPKGNATEQLYAMMALDTLPDMITLGWSESLVASLIKGKFVYSYDELAQKYDPDFMNVANKEKLRWYRQSDGKTYGYPNASWSIEDLKSAKTASSNYSFLVRKDIYKAIGEIDMTTPEGFLNALQTAKEKFPLVDGNPLIPVGFAEFGSTDSSFGTYLQDLLGIPYEKNGKIIDRRTDPEYIKWLKVFRKANSMGLISGDIFTDKIKQIKNKMADTRYFAIFHPWSDAQSPLTKVYNNLPDKMYISVLGPANSNKELKPIYPGPIISGWTLTFITKNCKDPEGALKLAKFMISEEGQKLTYLGKRGVTYDMIDGKEQWLPSMVNLRSSNKKEFDRKYGIEYMNWMFMDNAMQDRLWTQPNTGPLAQVKEFTFDKLESLIKYDAMDPMPVEREGMILRKINAKWNALIPKLLKAKTEVEFNLLYNRYLRDTKKLGIDRLNTYRTKKMHKNMKKLGLE